MHSGAGNGWWGNLTQKQVGKIFLAKGRVLCGVLSMFALGIFICYTFSVIFKK
jgi:hypothetical protein